MITYINNLILVFILVVFFKYEILFLCFIILKLFYLLIYVGDIGKFFILKIFKIFLDLKD